MMKNSLFLQAMLVISSIYVAAAAVKDDAGLRGALQAEAEAVKGVRELRGRNKPQKRSYYYDEEEETGDDYYYGNDDYYYGKGKGKGKGGGKKGGKKGSGKKGGKGKGGKGGGKGSYSDDYTEKGDDYYGGGKGSGKGGYSDDYVEKGDDYYGGGKGGGKGGYTDDFYPNTDDINFLDDNYFDDQFFEDDDCELVTLNETFTVPRASRFLAPDTSPENMGDPTLIGTVFIWENQQVYEPDGEVPIVGTRVSGTCTRTTTDAEGMGSCQLIFVDDDEYSINVDGLLTGPFGSQLAITGGTGGMVGVVGEMDFFPIFNMGEFDGDIFINITRYEIEADLGLIVCPHH